MKLEIATFPVTDIVFSQRTNYCNGILEIDKEELLEIEEFVQSTAFTWGLRILILGAVIILIRKNEWLTKAMKNKKIKVSLYIFYGVGFIGWLWGIIDLLLVLVLR